MLSSGHERGHLMTDISRKYKLSFSCPVSVLGTIMDAFLSESVTPTAVPATEAGRYKITATIWQESLPKIMGMIAQDAEQMVVAPVQELHPETRDLLPKSAGPQLVYDESQVRRIPAMVKPRATGKKAKRRDSPAGQAMLKCFERKAIAHFGDFVDALQAAGYSRQSAGGQLGELVNEGSVIRIGHGAYRLPNEQEKIEFRKKEMGVS